MVVVVMVAAAAAAVVVWWLLCVVGSLHLDALEQKTSAPKGKRFGACRPRAAWQRGGGMRVLGVFENWAGKCVRLI